MNKSKKLLGIVDEVKDISGKKLIHLGAYKGYDMYKTDDGSFGFAPSGEDPQSAYFVDDNEEELKNSIDAEIEDGDEDGRHLRAGETPDAGDDSAIEHYVSKYNYKMKGSSLEDMILWVSGTKLDKLDKIQTIITILDDPKAVKDGGKVGPVLQDLLHGLKVAKE